MYRWQILQVRHGQGETVNEEWKFVSQVEEVDNLEFNNH